MRRLLPSMLMLALPALVLSRPVRAEDLPRYDSGAYCGRMSGLSGGASPTLLQECLRGERRARDQLAPRWGRLSGDKQAYCDRLSRSAGGLGRYVRLKSCVDGQLAMVDRPRHRR